MEIIAKTFDQLDIYELHDLMMLRSEVFVVEQNCVYQDVDGKDPKALHVLGKKDGSIVAYTRCFPPGFYFEAAAIGRVVVVSEERKYGYGADIMKASLEAIKAHYKVDDVKLSAQTYLVKFYNSLGFSTEGEEYLEDGIPHILMIKN